MNLTDNEEAYSILIPLMVVAVVIYFVGVYFHVKIIQVSKKDKELTWRLDMTNSITSMVVFFISIFMHCITYIIRDLYLCTGQLFSYAFKVIGDYSAFYIMGHSLIKSLMKYTSWASKTCKLEISAGTPRTDEIQPQSVLLNQHE